GHDKNGRRELPEAELLQRLTILSYAKLNLYLKVRNRRKDNFHNIETLFERISLADRINLKSRPDKKIRIICSNPLMPKDNSNLCYRAAEIFKKKFKIDTGVDIQIIKRIPIGAGLGGGSSNAASVILGLNKLWGLKLSVRALARLAGRIGSDVPFFIYNTSFALAYGRGDKIRPLNNLNRIKLWHVLVVPGLKVSTPFIYGKWDELISLGKAEGLTMPKYNVNILISELTKKHILPVGLLYNSLENITVNLYSQVKNIQKKLKSLGLRSILMSGSG
ncbi:MAG: 4-(cytidine 5'-diphospho)-2-C-methyl-D-erythritol kinase, partial [Candidatus Omnitrophota bacterium]|nr:4-(cytidine 5'-diphospho)-2-C-methyl-D-erythritol kinase [Candidatus Omnitrophota bacterium]